MDPSIFIPSLIILILFGLVFVVGVGCIYLMLRYYEAEINKCPRCHKRRAATLVQTEVLNTRTYIDSSAVARMARGTGKWVKPDRILETTAEDHFTCRFCEHSWSQVIQERKRNPT